MVTLYQKIINEKLNVRQTEELVKKYLESKTKIKKIKNVSSPNLELTNIENDLVRLLGTKVTVQKNNKGKGKIHMDFYSDSDLQRLLDIIIK